MQIVATSCFILAAGATAPAKTFMLQGASHKKQPDEDMFKVLRVEARKSQKIAKQEQAYRDHEEQEAEAAAKDSDQEEKRVAKMIEKQHALLNKQHFKPEDADGVLKKLQDSMKLADLDHLD
mmetsp:Transcript_17090/g.41172  ORF Transcript_17090/g.41172 Transcript_17090/m.41172 type:complete len:122 (-) Transcript_17090:48-413(-)